ncbi:hypothetical protein [Stenoxybacter acetivorans]|uniref:hypothetical protein n=1 Tax=Stenoxybacter acetivorans TaxID=422441 RepID=UPI00056C20F7|nr:hypothetical protein [Stenoxybacter acetivorans]
MNNHLTTSAHEQLWQELANTQPDSSVVNEILASGQPIYYREDDTPAGLEIKEYPDGHRELVRFSRQGDEVIRIL